MSATRPACRAAPATSPALLIVGLGSSQGSDPLDRHASVLRASGRYGKVCVARLTSGLSPRDVLEGIDAPEVHVLPFLLSDGYCNRVLLPRVLGVHAPSARRSTLAGGQQVVRYLPPVAKARGLADLVRQRLLRSCAEQGLLPGEVDVLLFAHGLRGGSDAAEAHGLATELAATFRGARAAFLEQPPLFADALRQRHAVPTVVVGFFVASGMHGGRDISEAIVAARAEGGGPIHWAGNVGEGDAMSRLLLAHVDRELEEEGARQ